MTPAIKPFDPNGFSMFNVTDGVGNRVTIAVRQHHVSKPPMRAITDSGIQVVIWGDFGAMENYWPSCGKEPWWDWLEDTDMDYVMTKFHGHGWREFDFERSKSYLISEIFRMRREGVITKEDAREAYDEVSPWEGTSEDLFIQRVSDLTFTGTRYPHSRHREAMFEEYWEMTLKRPKPSIVNFWDTIWRPFIETAKRTKGTMRGVQQ